MLEKVVGEGDRIVSIHRALAKARHTGIEFEVPVAYAWTFRNGRSFISNRFEIQRRPSKPWASRGRRCRRRTWSSSGSHSRRRTVSDLMPFGTTGPRDRGTIEGGNPVA